MNNYKISTYKLLLLIFTIPMISAVFSCALSTIPQWDGPVLTQPRSELTVQDLGSSNIRPLLDMSFFAIPSWADEAKAQFSGSLSFSDTNMTYSIDRAFYSGENLFPAFSVDFLSHNGLLIPLQRDLIITSAGSDSLWDVMVGVGRIWHEDTDGSLSRASFPLSLTDRFIGQVRNAVMTFVYDENGVSNVYMQSSQETADAADGRLGDMRVMLSPEYTPRQYANAPDIIANYLYEKSNRLPVSDLSAIDSRGQIASYFDRSFITNASTSLGAVYTNGRLYLQEPQTRHGAYPYPDEMRHGLYSVTKSLAGSLSLMYLAQRYGDGIFDERISDYVPALAAHSGWQGVTFGQTLNMVSGTDGGEDAARLLNVIITAETAEEAINNVARLGDAAPAPGQSFNYASTNLFVLSYAMQNYVKQAEGPSADYWNMLKQDVLIPIGASHFHVQHTIEADGQPGIPFLAYGAAPTIDEAAKIAALFANDGMHNGSQLLSRNRVREALGSSEWAGVSTSSDWRGSTYRHGFWSQTIRVGGKDMNITYMLGFGGNYIIFLPSGTVIFRFMDEFDFDIDDLVRRVDKALS